jgi:hemolysin activation/secretion protein
MSKRFILACLIGALSLIPGSIIWAASPASGTLPPLESSGGNQLSEQESIKVKGFAFEGNTVFSQRQLEAVAQPFLDKRTDGRLTSEDLDAIRNQITVKYITAGYINSGAILPDQAVADGIIHFKIIEGRLSEIHLTHGNRAMQMAGNAPTTNPSAMQGMNMGGSPNNQKPPPTFHFLWNIYIINRVKVGAGPPLNINDLKTQLELLRQEPNIQAVNAELMPGDQLGESVLDLAVTERNPFQVGLQFGNPRSPSVGAYEMDVLLSDSDLLGFGDALNVHYGILAGPIDDLRLDSPKDYSIDYNVPFTRYDTSFDFNYARSSDLVVEAPFNAVDIQSRTDSYAAWIKQPIYRRPEQPEREFDLSVGVTGRYNTTDLLGQPFSLSPGANNGSSNATAIRFAQEYTGKTDIRAIALRSTFGFGFDGPDATIASNEPDSHFFDWLGQFQYVRLLPGFGLPSDSAGQAILRLNAQLSANRLLAVEQFGMGGMDTVRGYRQEQLVSDDAVTASIEVHIPLIQKSHQDVLDIAPFFDAGYAWNARNYTMKPELISAPGIGLLLNLGDHVNAAVYYGYALKKFPQTSHDLQDSGIDFTLTLNLF